MRGQPNMFCCRGVPVRHSCRLPALRVGQHAGAAAAHPAWPVRDAALDEPGRRPRHRLAAAAKPPASVRMSLLHCSTLKPRPGSYFRDLPGSDRSRFTWYMVCPCCAATLICFLTGQTSSRVPAGRFATRTPAACGCRATIQQLRRDPWVATDYKPTRASSFRPALESRTLDGMFDPSVALKSVEQPDDGWGALQAVCSVAGYGCRRATG